MSGIRPIIDSAVADVLAEHPKYFTPKGMEHARGVIVRKVMAAIRGDGAAAPADVPASAPSEPTHPIAVEPASREGRAYSNLRLLAGATAPFRMGDGKFSIPPEANCPAGMAFADLPPHAAWPFVTDHRKVGAWMEFFAEKLPGAPRRPIAEKRGDLTGILMPWPWPPSKDGKTYSDEETAE